MRTDYARAVQSHGGLFRSGTVTLTAAVAVAAMVWVTSTIAQSTSPAETIKARQQGLKRLGAAFKVVRDELRNPTADVAKLKAAASDITQAAAAIGTWFPAGTGPESGTRTEAKPEVWADAAGFAAAREAFVSEARKWAQLNDSPDAAAWKDAAAALGQSCKGCHDKYRVKKE